jgi:nicotinamidase-related amidase
MKSILFLCDIQSRFSPSLFSLSASLPTLLTGSAVHGFDHVVDTANKLLKIAKVKNHQTIKTSLIFLQILHIPVLATEQNPTALGNTVSDIDLPSLGALYLGTFPKTLFSMLTQPVQAVLDSESPDHIILIGIEVPIPFLSLSSLSR